MLGYTASKDRVNSMCCSVKLSSSSMQCMLLACLILNLINKWSTNKVYCQANKLCPSLIEKPSLPQLLCSPLRFFTLIPRQCLHFYSSLFSSSCPPPKAVTNLEVCAPSPFAFANLTVMQCQGLHSCV